MWEVKFLDNVVITKGFYEGIEGQIVKLPNKYLEIGYAIKITGLYNNFNVSGEIYEDIENLKFISRRES